MTLRDLYMITPDDTSIIVKDAWDDTLYFSGRFLDVPFKYLNYIVTEICPVDNTLVVRTYN